VGIHPYNFGRIIMYNSILHISLKMKNKIHFLFLVPYLVISHFLSDFTQNSESPSYSSLFSPSSHYFFLNSTYFMSTHTLSKMMRDDKCYVEKQREKGLGWMLISPNQSFTLS
jgi:hypothetical protein